MEQIFTTFNIQEFLAQQDFGLWTMNFHDPKTNKLRQAKNSDFGADSKTYTLEIIDNFDDKSLKSFAISEFSFAELKYDSDKKKNVIKKDLTIEWCSSLLDEHGIQYATALRVWCDNNIKAIDKAVQDKSKPLNAVQKNKFDKLRSLCSKLLIMAKNKINESKKDNGLSA